MTRLRVLVLFGGRSGEHEVSIRSARSVAEALDQLGHEVVGVGVSRRGRWVRCDPRSVPVVDDDAGDPFVLTPDPSAPRTFDVAFPVMHGPSGEDGSVQGLFELADVPYVGAGVEGSALALNKVVQKHLFRDAGLPTVEWVALRRADTTDTAGVRARISALGFPSFAKPVRLGSSVGISRIASSDDIDDAVERAFTHDDDVIVEAAGGPHELEVGVIGSDPLLLSVVGQAVPHGSFYDYGSKYSDGGTDLVIPALVPDAVEERIRDHAVRAFGAVHCEGFARVDFFWGPEPDDLLVNEINSIPGLTPTSMFPRVWEASGMPFASVVERLLGLAIERHGRRAQLEDARMAAHADEVGG